MLAPEGKLWYRSCRSGRRHRARPISKNREGLSAQLDTIAEQLALVNGGGGAKYVARHRKQGKLLVRERIELMLDPDTAFLELCPFAAWGGKFPVGGSVVVGIGVVEGIESMIIAHDPTVRGGASNPYTFRKVFRGMAIARENRHPSSTSSNLAAPTLAHTGRDLRARRTAVPRLDPAQRSEAADTGPGLRQLDRGRCVRPGHVRLRRDGAQPFQGVPRRSAAGQDGGRGLR